VVTVQVVVVDMPAVFNAKKTKMSRLFDLKRHTNYVCHREQSHKF